MDKTKEKDSVTDLLYKIPEDASYEYIIAEIYFKKQVEEGIEQLYNGQKLSMKRLRREWKSG